MNKKTMEILLMIFLVMIISISAISAADADDALQGEVGNANDALQEEVSDAGGASLDGLANANEASPDEVGDANEASPDELCDAGGSSLEGVDDANIETTSIASAQENNATLLASENGNDVEISVSDEPDEISNQEVEDASSNLNKAVLSASNDDVLKDAHSCFHVGNQAYDTLKEALENVGNGGTIKVEGFTYSNTDNIKLSIEQNVTIEAFPGSHVYFDGEGSKWLFEVRGSGTYVTFNNITFRNGKASQWGGAFMVVDGHLTLNDCNLTGNKAGDYGGAISLDDGATLIANNCRFENNWAEDIGGAISGEDDCSATLKDCYFNNNTAGTGDNFGNEESDPCTWIYSNCLFEGSGSLEIEASSLTRSVTITPDVDDDIDMAVLYKDGEYLWDEACNNNRPVTFDNLVKGTYTVYLMKGTEFRYNYQGTTFTLIEPNFIVDIQDHTSVYETLSAAVNSIPNGGSGIISVANGIYTKSVDFNVQIRNKEVTIMPNDTSDGADPVIFSSNSYNYFLDIGSGSNITMVGINITGKFLNSALIFNTDLECSLYNCIFENIVNSQNQPGKPIDATNSILVLDGCHFESNGQTLFKNTAVNITDCTFTSNSGSQGGAINADSSSNLTVASSEFSLNVASDKGGAIYASNLEAHDTSFIGNSAGLGGAVYITSLTDTLINITGCVFDTNLNTTGYRNIYSESLTRKFNLEHNEYDVDLNIIEKNGSYGEYTLEGIFDWGSNLNNTFTILVGVIDDENAFGDVLTVEDNKFNIDIGVLSGGSHNFTMSGMYSQGDSADHFYLHDYYSDLSGNEFYLINVASAKIMIDKAKIALNLEVNNVLIPEIPVLNVDANWDLNYTIFIGNKYYQLEVVNGKASMQLTGLDLGNYTVVGMREGDDNYEFVMNFTTFSISKVYSNFLVLSTNVEYDTLAEAVANSNNEDTIYIKNGTYPDTGVVIFDKILDIIALDGAVFDAQGGDANFIIVNESAVVHIHGITFKGLHNRNTNYGAIVNYGYLSLDSCNFIDNMITKTSFAENGGAAIFSNGESLEIDNCNFINNVAPLKVSTAAVTSLGYGDISITSSKFINNTAREGGALHFKNIVQFEDAIDSCEFEQNLAVKGSAIYVGNNSKYIGVTLSSFKNNDLKNNLGENAQLEGGVIYVNAKDSEVILSIDLSNFENNSNKDVDGGVLCLDGISKANIGSCIFKNNSGKAGSVILIKNPDDKKLTLVIDSSNFINNNAITGAIETSPKVITLIDDCIFANNTGEFRNIFSNGFTVAHDSIFDVKDANLKALSVQYGVSSIINGTADVGTNILAAANLTVADENIIVEIKDNSFTYKTGILAHGKYFAVLNGIVDSNNNTYLMDSITEIFNVKSIALDFNVSIDNITYGETIKIVERLPSNAMGTIAYYLNGKYYTKDEIESLKLDAGKYALAAVYDPDDFAFTSSIVNFEVYKANPIISVADVEVGCNENIILNIETNVPSIYTIEIEDFKTIVFINGSRSVEIENTFEPGDHTIKVTSQERVNYISNSSEATLKVNENLPALMSSGSENIANPGNMLGQSLMNSFPSSQGAIDDTISNDETVSNEENSKLNLNKASILTSSDSDSLGDENEGNFIYQYDEEDSDYVYFETLEDAISHAELNGAGIITVRGGRYSGDEFRGIYLEGEMELTIKAYGDEEVIFDCGNEDYFLYLTYETIVEPIATPPFFETYQTEGPTVTLQNITVINGYNGDGGAIEMDAGTLILTDCNFLNNNADYGGAIYIGSKSADEGAAVIGYNTTFINNFASDEGGAIYMGGGLLQDVSVTFYLCTFLGNHQGEDEEYMINYFAGSDVEKISSKYCIFNGNATINSLDIDKINQTVTVNGSSTDPFTSVVLLYVDQTPLYSINNNGKRDFNVTFEDVIGGNYTVATMDEHNFNTYVSDEKFEMKVPNFIISEDEVYENLTDAIEAVAENGIIYANANYYTEDNLEIDISKSFTLKNFRDRTVVFDGSGEKWFFTIAEGCSVVFEGICFTDGAVKTFAAIENYGNLIIKNCSFNGFETSEIIHNSHSLNILGSEFSLNSVNNALVWNDGTLFIDTVEFSSNIINISSVVYNNGAAEIVSSNFTENSNGGNGGAIYSTNSLSIKDTVFKENEGKDGGAVYNTGILQVLNSTFEDNSANGYGGAIFNGNEANIFNSTFTGGCSEKDGGAIYNDHTMTVDNSTFVGNTATGNGGAIYNNGSLILTKSFFGINFADEFANIYNAGDIQFSENTFDFYDVILLVPDGEYGIPTTIAGTLNPEFNMDIQVTLPGFLNNEGATVTISDGVFEYVTDILQKGIYPVKLDEVIFDSYGNVYYGESKSDRLIINKANVYINLTVENIVLQGTTVAPTLNIDASKDGLFHLLFNNKVTNVTVSGGHASVNLEAVGEGNYTVLVFREGDENYKDAVNETKFTVSKYEGNFIVNSTGSEFETLREALVDSAPEDIIYVREGNYSGADNLGLTISNKKLSIIPLGDVVFDGNSSGLHFLTVDGNADVTISDVVLTGFNTGSWSQVISNNGNLTVDGCIFANNTIVGSYPDYKSVIYNNGNLNIVGSGFYDNNLRYARLIYSDSSSNITVNDSTFENNTLYREDIIFINRVNSAKIISNDFTENKITGNLFNIIYVYHSNDVLISSEFYNNTLDGDIICADYNNTLLVNDSIFAGNKASQIISSEENDQITISGSLFAENTVKNVVLSYKDKNLFVLESTFSDNMLSDKGALKIMSDINATVNGSVFINNNADEYRNIYSVGEFYSVCDVNISNTVFDALNVDYTVHDMDYGQNETIEGTIDIGTNLNFTVNLDINSTIYSVNVTDNKFTYTSGILKGGDYYVVLNAKDNDSNTYLFNKITKIFSVNRIDPELSVSIDAITQGEKLKVNVTISKNVVGHVVFELNGIQYSKDQLENLTLSHGNYLVKAVYRGDKNYLPVTKIINVEVNKITPSITVKDAVVNYGEDIKINVTVDVADYYTVFIGDESLTLYVADNAIFTFSSLGFKPNSYEIMAYVFESDDYAEAYGNALLTVNKATGLFNLSDDLIAFGDNATINVTAPVNAYGNITYEVYAGGEMVYTIKQSCLEKLVVPNLFVGDYSVKGTFEGDSYYAVDSVISSGTISVIPKAIDLRIDISDITLGENATVLVESNVDGDYLVYVDDVPYIVNVVGGKGNKNVAGLALGKHSANVTSMDIYYSAVNSTTFEVTKAKDKVDIKIGNVSSGKPIINVTLPKDATGNVKVYVNGKLAQIVNLVNGSALIIVPNLVVGKNVVKIAYSGDKNYEPFTKSVVINRKTTIVASGMTRGYNSGLDYTAKLLKDDGTPLVNKYVKIKVGTNTYYVKTNSKGILKFNKKLAVGRYAVAIINPVTGEYKLTNLRIVKRIAGNKNVKRFFADGSIYKVRIIGDNGKYVGKGKVVKMRVAGKTYSVKTDKKGYAKLRLRLKARRYTITIKYKGYVTKNKVTVRSVVRPLKKTVIFGAKKTSKKVKKVSKAKKTSKFVNIKVKLKGKKVLKKKRVYMRFRGKTYKAKTNRKGIATFKVSKKVIKKLKKGRKYKAVFTYKAKANGKTIKDTAKCYVKYR